MAGVVINCSTKIGNGCIVKTSASIDHDTILEDCVYVSPGVNVAGGVIVGKRTWLGIGFVIINNLSLCTDCIVGAGSVVS